MPRVLLAGRIHDDGMAVLRRRDIVIEEMKNTEPAAFLRLLPNADALLIRTAMLPREALVRADRLKVVSRHGVGYDNVPVDALTAKGIPLAVVGGIHSDTVAEHAFFLMLALAKNALPHDAATRTGGWTAARSDLKAFELSGRTLLLIGFGRIGRALARRALAFGMTVLAYDPNVGVAEMQAAGVCKAADWRAVLPEADAVSLHVPRLPETENMIGAAELALMKPTAMLINTSRGGLIDERALAEALAAGSVGGAGLDVFEEEPPREDHPLLASDRVILSPHIAGLTQEASARLSIAAAENVLAALDGRLDPALVVNPEVLKSRKTGT